MVNIHIQICHIHSHTFLQFIDNIDVYYIFCVRLVKGIKRDRCQCVEFLSNFFVDSSFFFALLFSLLFCFNFVAIEEFVSDVYIDCFALCFITRFRHHTLSLCAFAKCLCECDCLQNGYSDCCSA